MRAFARCVLLLAGVIACNTEAYAKTIVVDFQDATVFLKPARHVAMVHAGMSLRVSVPLLERQPAVAQAPNMTALQADLGPVQQADVRAMLVLGAFLVAHQLRRKHRSLKQSLIAG